MTAFDPYHVWLGIPPEEQPANHYRLLGLRAFESNADAIDHAADRHAAHLRSFSAGERAGIAQKLLNEVAAARVCLLDAAKKAEYDAGLRAALMPAPASVAPPAMPQMAVPPSVAPPSARPAWKHAPIPVAPLSPPPSAAPSRPVEAAPLVVGAGSLRRRKSAPPIVPIVVIGLLVIGGIVALSAMNSNSSDSKTKDDAPSVASQDDPPKSPDSPQQPTSPLAVLDVDLNKPPASPSTGEGNEPAKVETPIERPPDIPGMPENPPPETPQAEERPPEMPPGDPEAPFEDLLKGKSPDSPAAEPVPENRPPVPDEAERTAKEKEIRSLLTKEFAQTKPQEIWEFGRALLALGNDTKNDPVGRYVIYNLTIERAAKSGDAETARTAAEQIAKEYAVDRLDTVGGAILAVARGGVPVAVRPVAMQQAKELAKQTFAGDRLGLAKSLTAEWVKLAGQLRDADATTEAKAFNERVAAAQGRWADVAKALEALKTMPDDAAANAIVGRYRCLVKGEWTVGLPQLAKADDADLKAIAEAELKPDNSADAQIAIADSWRKQSEKLADDEKQAAIDRALDTYLVAMPKATGLRRASAGMQIRELQLRHKNWIDLFQYIDPARDTGAGSWRRLNDGSLEGTDPHGQAIVNSAIEPVGSYEFMSEFASRGHDTLYFLPVADHATVLQFNGFHGVSSWIDTVDGQRAGKRNPTTVSPTGIATGVRYSVHTSVRLQGKNANILVRVNGQNYLAFRGEASRLGRLDYATGSDPKRLGLGTWHTTVTYYSLRFRYIQ